MGEKTDRDTFLENDPIPAKLHSFTIVVGIDGMMYIVRSNDYIVVSLYPLQVLSHEGCYVC